MDWSGAAFMDAGFLAFIGVAALLIVTPGPDTALIIRNAIAAGPRAATFSAIGVATGTLAWVCAASVGVGLLVEESSIAFTLLKLAGAAYLVYLGLRSLLARPALEEPSNGALHRPLGDAGAYRQGLLSNLLNPKTGAFFVTVMPQFLSVGDSPVRLVAMTITFEVMLLAWLIAYGHVVSRAGRSSVGIRVRRAVTQVTGVVLIGLGARLALDHT